MNTRIVYYTTGSADEKMGLTPYTVLVDDTGKVLNGNANYRKGYKFREITKEEYDAYEGTLVVRSEAGAAAVVEAKTESQRIAEELRAQASTKVMQDIMGALANNDAEAFQRAFNQIPSIR